MSPAPAAGVRWWVAASTVSWFGDGVFAVALAWVTVHLTTPLRAGLIVGCAALPAAVLTLVGGVIADRLPTRGLLVSGVAVRMLALAGGIVAWWAGVDRVTTLIVVQLAFGVAAGLSNPARSTLTRQLVPAEDLPVVGGRLQIGYRVGRLLAAPAGAALAAGLSPVPAMALDLTTFGVVTVVLLSAVHPRYPLPRESRAALPALRDGLVYLAGSATVRALAIGVGCLNVFVVPVTSVGVALQVRGQGWPVSLLGAGEAALGVGAILGSLVAMRRRPRRQAVAAFRMFALEGLAMVLPAVAGPAGLLLGMVGIGVGAGLGSVWISVALQRTVASVYLGRVSAVTQLGDLTLVPLATPLLGWLAGSLSPAAALVAFGAAMVLLCGLLASGRAVRELAF